MLHRAIQLTVYAHEWYWNQVWMECAGSIYSLQMPKIYLLHQFYRQYCDELTEFEGYANWQAVIRRLGSPVTWRGTLGAYLSYGDRYHTVRDCFTSPSKKKRRRRYWCRHIGGKWQKNSEPSPEVVNNRKEQREQKNLWRMENGKTKDYRNREQENWRRGPGRFWKRERSKKYRRWIARAIYIENYDIIADGRKDRRWISDSWCWD